MARCCCCHCRRRRLEGLFSVHLIGEEQRIRVLLSSLSSLSLGPEMKKSSGNIVTAGAVQKSPLSPLLGKAIEERRKVCRRLESCLQSGIVIAIAIAGEGNWKKKVEPRAEKSKKLKNLWASSKAVTWGI